MKILHVVPSYFPAVRYGGPIWSVHGLAAGQAALGHHVQVFTTNADGPGSSAVPLGKPVEMDGVHVSYFGVRFPRRLFRAPGLAIAVREHVREFDVVHLHSVFLWPTLVAARIAARARVPYLLSPRGMLVSDLIRIKSSLPKRLWVQVFERRTIQQAAAVHVTAAREAEDFAALGLVARRIVNIPNGVDPPVTLDQPISPDIAAATASPYALYLGRLNWKKNLPALISAMAHIPELRLVIAGNDDEGHSTALYAAITSHGLCNRAVIVARSIDGADKAALFAGATLFVLPSLNENFGNTVLEAMAWAKPVVVSDGAGVAEVVRRANCGFVVQPEPGALREAIAALAADPARARTMGEAGAHAARRDFGWRTVAAQMIDAYRMLGALR